MADMPELPDGFAVEYDRPIGFSPAWEVYRAAVADKPATAFKLLPEVLDAGPDRARLAGGRSTQSARTLDPANAAALSVVTAEFERQIAPLLDPAAQDAGLARVLFAGRADRSETLWLVIDVDWNGLFAERVPAAPQLDAALLHRAARRLGTATAYLHSRGILHCGIAPDVLSLSPVMLLAGITPALRTLAGSAATQGLLADTRFAPPELFDRNGGTALGPWTDIYMAAATLHWLATGCAPKPLSARPSRPAAYRAQVLAELATSTAPAGVREAIATGLAARIAERPQRVEEWLELVGSEPAPVSRTPAPRVSTSHGSTPHPKRRLNRSTAALIGAGAIALGSAAWLSRPPPAQTEGDEMTPPPGSYPETPDVTETVGASEAESLRPPVVRRYQVTFAKRGVIDFAPLMRPWREEDGDCGSAMVIAPIQRDGKLVGLRLQRSGGGRWDAAWTEPIAASGTADAAPSAPDDTPLRLTRMINADGSLPGVDYSVKSFALRLVGSTLTLRMKNPDGSPYEEHYRRCEVR